MTESIRMRLNGVTTTEPCAICGRNATCDHGENVEVGPRVAEYRLMHYWHCPECGDYMVHVGYECPCCLARVDALVIGIRVSGLTTACLPRRWEPRRTDGPSEGA